MTKEQKRREGNVTLLLVDKLARPARKKKKNFFFFSATLRGLKVWRNRKRTICAMLVSVHDIEIAQFFLPLVVSSVNTANHKICIQHRILEFPSTSSRILWCYVGLHSSSRCGALPAARDPRRAPSERSVCAAHSRLDAALLLTPHHRSGLCKTRSRPGQPQRVRGANHTHQQAATRPPERPHVSTSRSLT